MRTFMTGAILAAATLVPAATAFAENSLYKADFWRRISEQRLDRALGDYRSTSTRPATKIGEVSMAMTDDGALSNPQMTRSTGEAGADTLLMNAANRLGSLPAPPEGVDARTVLLRVAFVTPSGVAPWQEYRPQREPFVYIEQAGRSETVVISAVR